jgi:hypothetical protein
MDDWRIDNARWTRGAILHFRAYTRYSETWDHDHCEACWDTFMETGSPDILTEGYVADDNRWICAQCFEELKEEMGWTLA